MKKGQDLTMVETKCFENTMNNIGLILIIYNSIFFLNLCGNAKLKNTVYTLCLCVCVVSKVANIELQHI